MKTKSPHSKTCIRKFTLLIICFICFVLFVTCVNAGRNRKVTNHAISGRSNLRRSPMPLRFARMGFNGVLGGLKKGASKVGRGSLNLMRRPFSAAKHRINRVSRRRFAPNFRRGNPATVFVREAPRNFNGAVARRSDEGNDFDQPWSDVFINELASKMAQNAAEEIGDKKHNARSKEHFKRVIEKANPTNLLKKAMKEVKDEREDNDDVTDDDNDVIDDVTTVATASTTKPNVSMATNKVPVIVATTPAVSPTLPMTPVASVPLVAAGSGVPPVAPGVPQGAGAVPAVTPAVVAAAPAAVREVSSGKTDSEKLGDLEERESVSAGNSTSSSTTQQTSSTTNPLQNNSSVSSSTSTSTSIDLSALKQSISKLLDQLPTTTPNVSTSTYNSSQTTSNVSQSELSKITGDLMKAITAQNSASQPVSSSVPGYNYVPNSLNGQTQSSSNFFNDDPFIPAGQTHQNTRPVLNPASNPSRTNTSAPIAKYPTVPPKRWTMENDDRYLSEASRSDIGEDRSEQLRPWNGSHVFDM